MPPFKFVDHATIDRMLDMYQSGKSAADTAKEFGVCPYTVYNWLKAKGRKVRTFRKPPLAQKDIDKAVSLYASGESAVSVGGKLGISVPTVLRVVRENGGQTRLPGRIYGSGVVDKMTPQEYTCHLEQMHPGIVQMIQEGKYTLKAIGDRYGLTRERVRQYERAMDLQPRSVARHEAGEIKKRLRALNREKIKADRLRKWQGHANRMTALILTGASTEELISALPWKIHSGNLPRSMRLALMLSRLRQLSGVDIPKRK